MPQKAWTMLRTPVCFRILSSWSSSPQLSSLVTFWYNACQPEVVRHDLRRYDMNRRSQMKGGITGFCWRYKCKPVLLRLSLAGNLEKPLMSLYGTEWRERGYGLWWIQIQGGQNWILLKEMNANRFFWDSHWLEIWSNHLFSSMGTNGGSLAMDVLPSLFICRYNTTELTCPTS